MNRNDINYLSVGVFVVIMAIVLIVIPHPTRLSTTVALTLLGAAIYIIILLPIDEEARSLVGAILQELRVRTGISENG